MFRVLQVQQHGNSSQPDTRSEKTGSGGGRGEYKADASAVLTSLGVHVHSRQVESLDEHQRQGP
jgi:hypothetical protein